jgi:hypothetical protein
VTPRPGGGVDQRDACALASQPRHVPFDQRERLAGRRGRGGHQRDIVADAELGAQTAVIGAATQAQGDAAAIDDELG